MVCVCVVCMCVNWLGRSLDSAQSTVNGDKMQDVRETWVRSKARTLAYRLPNQFFCLPTLLYIKLLPSFACLQNTNSWDIELVSLIIYLSVKFVLVIILCEKDPQQMFIVLYLILCPVSLSQSQLNILTLSFIVSQH